MLITNNIAYGAAKQIAGGFTPIWAVAEMNLRSGQAFGGTGECGANGMNGGEAARFFETFRVRKEPPTEYLTASEPVNTGKGSVTA